MKIQFSPYIILTILSFIVKKTIWRTKGLERIGKQVKRREYINCIIMKSWLVAKQPSVKREDGGR